MTTKSWQRQGAAEPPATETITTGPEAPNWGGWEANEKKKHLREGDTLDTGTRKAALDDRRVERMRLHIRSVALVLPHRRGTRVG